MSPTDQLPPRAIPAPVVGTRERIGAAIDFSDPHSPLAPFYLRSSAVVACGILALIFLLLNSIALWHTDVWAHAKFGEWIWTHGCLPDREPFCAWSDHDAPFVQFYTLSQLSFYFLYQFGARLAGGDEYQQLCGGVEMLRLAYSLLVIARFTLLFLAYRRLTGSTRLACVALPILLLLSLPTMGVMRPQLFGELFFAGLLFALSRPLLSRGFLAGIPILFILWANSHGSFVIGLSLLGLFLVGRAIETAHQHGWRQIRANVQVRRLLLALVLAAGGSCINPHGPALYRHALGMASSPVLAALAEWRPLGVFPSPWLVGVPFVGSLILLAFTQLRSPRPFTPTEILLILFFGLGACVQQRFLIWWIMLTPWIVLAHWESSASTSDPEPGPSGASFRKTLLAGALTYAVLMWSPSMGWLLHGSPRSMSQLVVSATPWELARQLRYPDDPEAKWSPELAETLRANYPGGRFTGSIFVSETLGDYLVWELSPQVPLSSYSHFHLFPRTYWEEVGVIYGGQPGWWDLLRRRQANLVVIEAEGYPQLRNRLRADPGWKIVVDEAGDRQKGSASCRLFIAIRKKPV